MLVLAATKGSETHGWFIDEQTLDALFARTFKFLGQLTPHSVTMRTNVKILENAKRELAKGRQSLGTSSAAASFGSNH